MVNGLGLPVAGKTAPPRWHDYVPDYKLIDRKKSHDRVSGGKHAGTGDQVALDQVQAFVLLGDMHAYIKEVRRELEAQLCTTLCREHCCCLDHTPLVSVLEARYQISRADLGAGYYSKMVEAAERWLLADHECAKTKPYDEPGAVGGKSTPLANLPHVAAQMKALHRTRSPFLVVERASGADRLVSGAYHKTSYADGTNIVHAENRDILGDTHPLACAVNGVFKLAPQHCTRRPGIGESERTRVVADPKTLQHYHGLLMESYGKLPGVAAIGFLPTLIVQAARPVQFAQYVRAGKVALAKLVMMDGRKVSPMPLWDEQPAGVIQRKIISSPAGGTGGTRIGRVVADILGGSAGRNRPSGQAPAWSV